MEGPGKRRPLGTDELNGEMMVFYPIFTLDQRLLVPAETLLTWDRVNELAEANASAPGMSLPLLSFGTVNRDLVRFMAQPPYRTIFDPPERRDAVLRMMERLSLPKPVLEALGYFGAKDDYTYRHILMVFALSVLVARELLENDLDLLREALGGPVHDFGKICVPMRILKKTNPLTRTERGILEHHAIAGFALLAYHTGDARSFGARVARDHHERGDGTGYPRGLPLTDRMVEIIAASDIYDALISPRPYRPTPYDNRTALEEITDLSLKGKLGWEVVQTLVSFNRKEKPHFRECTVSVERRGIPPLDNQYGVVVEEEPRDDGSGG